MTQTKSDHSGNPTWTARGVALYLAQVLAVAIGYQLLGEVGRLVSITEAQITAFWLPSGLALAALLLGGLRLWPGILLGHAFGNYLTYTSFEPLTRLLVAPLPSVGATLQAVVGAWLARRYLGSQHPTALLSTPGQVLWFLGPVSLLATFVSPSVGVPILIQLGLLPANIWQNVWITWYLGDLLGILVLTPLILAWMDRRWLLPPKHALIEALVLTVLTGTILYVTLLKSHYVTVHLFLPLLAWASWRFGARGATLSLLAGSFFTAVSVLERTGPFTGTGITPNTSMQLGQLFILNCVGAALILAAASSRRLRLEWELRLANADLEQRVTDRTTELSNRNQELSRTIHELEQARERLMFQSRMAGLGALTSGVAHEIRNPLNFILNFSELSSELSEELREAVLAGIRTGTYDLDDIQGLATDIRDNLLRIVEHSKRADRIVGSMLEHSRDVGGDFMETRLESLITDHVRIAIQNITASSPAEPIAYEIHSDPGVGPVFVCPKSLSRVILNIADNACQAVHQWHYGPDGPKPPNPRIVVHIGVEGPDTIITLTDNGPGIPPEVLPRVLEPFFTTKASGTGSGLGLSLAYAIVHDEHGGRLEVSNVPGGGVQVRVSIPTEGKPGARIPLFQPEDPKNFSGIGIPAIRNGEKS